MKPNFPIRALLAAAAMLLHQAATAADIELRLHGSNTLGAKLAPDLLEAYARASGFQDVKRIETAPAEYQVTGLDEEGRSFAGTVKAHGTNTGFADLMSGRADVWMASRVASVEEAASSTALGDLHSVEQEHVIALDGLAIAVHPGNPINRLSVSQVAAAFTGKVDNWSQLGGPDRPIKLYARDANSGTFDSFKSMVLTNGGQVAASALRFESSSELERAVAADPAALGFVGLSSLKTAKALALFEGSTLPLEPNALSVATEEYLLSRRLYFYTTSTARPEVRAFIEFALAQEGQSVAANLGFIAQRIFVAKETPVPGNPPGYYDVVASADRLSLNFRFRPRSSVLDSRALRDINRLSDFMKEPGNRHKQLRLAAFGVHDGQGSPFLVLFSVNDRVDHIAQMLGNKGVATRMSRGFIDGKSSVAAGARPLESAPNERVEVWLYDPKA